MSSEVLDQCRDFFVRYPSSKGETYGQHLIKNLSLACQKSLESTVLLIHGIFPNVDVAAGRKTAAKLLGKKFEE